MSYRFTLNAHRDITDLAAEIGKLNPSAADRLIDLIYDACELLSSQPRIGRQRDHDLKKTGLRSFGVAANYLIFYRITAADDIEILRILYGGRDLVRLFEDQ